MRIELLSLLLLVLAPTHATSDYAREKNWGDEITPGIADKRRLSLRYHVTGKQSCAEFCSW